MRLIAWLIPATLLVSTAFAQATFDAAFEARSMAHVRYLAGLGNRVAGSDGEHKAIQYVREQLKNLGVDVTVEPFEFKSFRLEKATVLAGDDSAEVSRLVFNPYETTELSGPVEFVSPEVADDWGQLSKLDLANRLVLAKGRANPYRLAFRGPRAPSRSSPIGSSTACRSANQLGPASSCKGLPSA